jgi:DNA-binding NarL/FixJ family response regulator
MKKQRILIVDDHEVVRLGLKALLEHHQQFEVVGEAGSAREAIERTDSLKADVVIMDIRMPGMSGIEACEEIVNRFPETKVIMLTSYAEDEMLFSAIRAGASGYILKQIDSEDLVKALEAVGRGEALLDPAVTQRVFQQVRRAVKEEEASAFAHLSQQEKHVLLLVSEGKTNREIAKALYLGEGTVRNYVSSILSKLGVNNRAEAAAYAVQPERIHHHVIRVARVSDGYIPAGMPWFHTPLSPTAWSPCGPSSSAMGRLCMRR